MFRSQYAIAEQPEGELGAYGAVLLKPWMPRAGGWREGEEQPVGTVVPAEVTQAWPLRNCLAMDSTNFVRFFVTEEEGRAAGVYEETVKAAVQAHPIRARLTAESQNRAVDHMARMRAAKALKQLEKMGLKVPAGAVPPATALA